MIDEDKKFLKLLELLGHYQEKGSVIIFVDKQEHADGLLKDLMKASYPCMSLHGGEGSNVAHTDLILVIIGYFYNFNENLLQLSRFSNV